jgi:hypothetical protein
MAKRQVLEKGIRVAPGTLLIQISDELVQEFLKAYPNDANFRAVYERAKEERPHNLKQRAYRLSEKGLLYFEDADKKLRLCVPTSLQESIIREVHDSPHEGAHTGWEKTLAKLRDRFYWPSMRQDVIQYVRTCDPCQKVKHDRGAKVGYLHPLRIPAAPFETISMDFVTGLPTSRGYDAILVIVDKFTKYGVFVPTKTTVDADGSAQLLLRHVVRWFGLPREIVSDRDPRWKSDFWKSLAAAFQTRLAMSSAHHPQTDGQTEVMNQHVEVMLRAYVNADRSDWVAWLPILQAAYNNAEHSAHGSSPAALLLGFRPRMPSDFLLENMGCVEKVTQMHAIESNNWRRIVLLLETPSNERRTDKPSSTISIIELMSLEKETQCFSTLFPWNSWKRKG